VDRKTLIHPCLNGRKAACGGLAGFLFAQDFLLAHRNTAGCESGGRSTASDSAYAEKLDELQKAIMYFGKIEAPGVDSSQGSLDIDDLVKPDTLENLPI
jgi:hypothetical protein